MTTITLTNNTECGAAGIHLMTARPNNINLANLQGQGARFTCSNPLVALQGATSVDITYDGAHGGRHENIQISSVMN